MIFVILLGIFVAFLVVGLVLELRAWQRRRRQWLRIDRLASQLPQEFQHLNESLARLDTAIRQASVIARGGQRSEVGEAGALKSEPSIERMRRLLRSVVLAKPAGAGSSISYYMPPERPEAITGFGRTHIVGLGASDWDRALELSFEENPRFVEDWELLKAYLTASADVMSHGRSGHSMGSELWREPKSKNKLRLTPARV